ncbi:MAG TPA: hypothetical protein DEA08_36715 [Planctomycetes bacterium]|nr:hypothetical protein [Planctomycetota bacterium]
MSTRDGYTPDEKGWLYGVCELPTRITPATRSLMVAFLSSLPVVCLLGNMDVLRSQRGSAWGALLILLYVLGAIGLMFGGIRAKEGIRSAEQNRYWISPLERRFSCTGEAEPQPFRPEQLRVAQICDVLDRYAVLHHEVPVGPARWTEAEAEEDLAFLQAECREPLQISVREAEPAEEGPEVEVEPETTCPYCHDGLSQGGLSACHECGTLVHAECAAELSRCTTLGCGGSFRRVRARRVSS